MRNALFLIPAIALMACESGGGDFATGGLSGDGNGSGGGDADAFATYDASLAAVEMMDPTSDLPSNTTASYSGQVVVDIENGFGVELGRILGDVAMTVDFATNAETVDGSISNVTGETATGDPLRFDGSLTTQAASTAGFGSTVSTKEIAAPPTGVDRSGSLFAQFLGDLDQTDAAAGDGYDGRVLITLGGTFQGQGGSGIVGDSEAVAPDAFLPPFVGEGTFYATQ